MNLKFVGQGLRILDFDVECRPLSWYGGDWVTREITAIAWKPVGTRGKPTVACLGEMPGLGVREDLRSILHNFCLAYDQADMVTGHYIRGFDLGVINAALLELGMPLLGDKLTHDTKLDMVKASGMSKSQENLGAMFELAHPKVSMSQADWRDANRLTVAGIARTRKRVVGDVNQHIELRAAMMAAGALGKPKMWSCRPSGSGKYSP